MATDLFGLELVFKTVGSDFKKKEDALIALAHWIAVKSRFSSIGLGDDKKVTGEETGSELLPVGWNDSETYAIRYLREKELFILRGIRTDETLIINLLRTADLQVSNVALNIEEAVKSLTGALNEIIPDYQALTIRFKRELIDPCTKETKQEATTQTPTTPQEPVGIPIDPLQRRDPLRRTGAIPIIDPYTNREVIRDPQSPLNVGHADLNPLGGGGGMLFQPFGPPNRRNLPRGGIPGARFDPLGPFPPRSGGGGFGPDPDHLPPPGYDDIYM